MRRDPCLLAYDIRDPKRLRRVHRFMLKWGVAVQYSVFAVSLDPDEIEEMMAGLARLADAEEDDIRLYRVPSGGGDWHGRKPVSDALVLAGKSAPEALSGERRRRRRRKRT